MQKVKRFHLIMIVAVAFVLSAAVASASSPAGPMSREASEQPSASQSSAEATGASETLLPSGSVLVIGGQVSSLPVATAFLKDSHTGALTQIPGKLNYARSWHTATLMPDGTVLVLGGVGTANSIVSQAEVFDPVSETFSEVPTVGLTPRAYHSATLLTDGRVLIAGGADAAGADLQLDLWDFRAGQTKTLTVELPSALNRHTATLLPDGTVLLWGGIDDLGNALNNGVIVDPRTSSIQLEATAPANSLQPPQLEESIPPDGAKAVPLNVLLALRFSESLDVSTVNTSNISLTASQGSSVAVKVVPAENGRLAFINPQAPLLSDTIYTLSLQNLADPTGQALPSTTIEFATVESVSGAAGTGNTGSGLESPWLTLPPLTAPPGVTALAAQVLKLNGAPLPHVLLQLDSTDSKSVYTDKTGRFLMPGITAGHHVMYIEAETANSKTQVYGLYRVGVDITAGRTNVLNYTIWMTPLDTQHVVTFPSPTTSEVVVTNPEIPSLELHIPANTVVVDAWGRVINHLGITPIPMNQPPFPLKAGVVFPVYFTIQPGGASFVTTSTAWTPAESSPKGAQIRYQNYPNAAAGAKFDFWNYDPFQKGWYVYGRGRVSNDRTTIIPDNGTQIWSFDGAMVSLPGNAPPTGPKPGNPTDGEPVDLQTGLFIYTKTDLVLSDVIPLVLTRTYRQDDAVSRAFGIGASMQYDMFLVGDSNVFPEGYTYQDLVLADGGRVHFTRISPCDASGYCDYTNAVYAATSLPGEWYGATLAYQSNDTWALTKKDGTFYLFPDSDGSGNPRLAAVIGMHDRYGNALTFARDGIGNLLKLTSPNGRWIQFTYDGVNRVTQAQDNMGRIVNYAYDSAGRLHTATDANGGVTAYTYDGNDDMLTITDPRNITYLTNSYDVNDRVSQQIQGDGGNFYFTYALDGNGNVTQTTVTDPRQYIRQVAFNSDGWMVSDTRAVGRPEQQTVTYNRQQSSGLILSATDALNRQTAYTYDSMGNTTGVTRLAGTQNAVTTNFTYEPTYNQLTSIVDPLGHTTSLTRDSHSNAIAITDPLGNSYTIAYNSAGQATSVTDPIGNAVQLAYNGGDLVGITDPLGRTVSRFVDAAGRVGSVTDPLGNITKYAYDPLNEITSITDPVGNQSVFTYDGNGNLLTVTDANQNQTVYTYNNMDRIQTRQDPLKNVESYQYDLAGILSTFTDRRGKVTTYSYDGLNRRIFTGFGTQSGPSYESTINYTYDLGNRLTMTVDSSTGTIAHGFDGLNRLTSEVTPQGSVNYTYDAAGRRQTMTVAGQPVVNYTFDAGNGLTQLSQGTNNVAFVYDADRRRSSLTLPNAVVVNYSYDAASQLTGINYQSGAAELGNLAYTYDLAGRRVGSTGSLAHTLLPAAVSSAAYNANNQLTNWNGTSLSYDADGNMTGNGGQSFVWNARNQLVSFNGLSFQYDAFGRRTMNAAGTGFLYDGANAVQELTGSTVTANILAGGVDENFLRTDAGGSWDFLSDALGSTVALTDSTGTVQTQYSYEPFGNTTSSGLSASNPAQYTGQDNDGTGLYFYRSRYYSPAMGRFISEDPIGFAGGQANLYAYVGDSPLSFVDPFGMDKNPGPPQPPPNGPNPNPNPNPNPIPPCLTTILPCSQPPDTGPVPSHNPPQNPCPPGVDCISNDPGPQQPPKSPWTFEEAFNWCFSSLGALGPGYSPDNSTAPYVYGPNPRGRMVPLNDDGAGGGNALSGAVGILGDIGSCINSLMSE